MHVPFMDGRVEDRDARDGQFLEGWRERRLGADRSEEGGPSVCYGGVVEECQVEGDEWAGVPASGDAGVDGRGIFGWRSRGGVGDTHGGMGGGCEGLVVVGGNSGGGGGLEAGTLEAFRLEETEDGHDQGRGEGRGAYIAFFLCCAFLSGDRFPRA